MDSTTTFTNQPVIDRLVEAARSHETFDDVYDSYMQALLSEPLWTHDSPRQPRLPWRVASEANKQDQSWTNSLAQRGLYLFGSSAQVLLYWGMTARQTLWKRVNGRYTSLGSKSSMFPIASKYESDLCSNGFDGFPEDFVEEFVPRQRYRKFLELAADFAPHGIDGIWLTVVPLTSDDDVPVLESRIIRMAKKWNRSHALPPLLNTHHA